MEFGSTNLAHNIAHGLYNEKGYDVAEAHIDKLYYTLFYGVAHVLKDNMSKEAPTSFLITEVMGKPIAAATVEYFNGEGNKPGNWSLVWTFNPDEIPENANKIDLQNDLTHPYFREIAGTKYGMRFHDKSAIVVLMTYIVEQLYKWLDENAKEGEVVDIELDNIFTAKVEIVDGTKVFAVDPAGEVKTIIKDDSSIEK
jgi:hypothetical protein